VQAQQLSQSQVQSQLRGFTIDARSDQLGGAGTFAFNHDGRLVIELRGPDRAPIRGRGTGLLRDLAAARPERALLHLAPGEPPLDRGARCGRAGRGGAGYGDERALAPSEVQLS
jgi:hypothetical protein